MKQMIDSMLFHDECYNVYRATHISQGLSEITYL